MYRYFKRASNTNNDILSCKSERFSDESIKSPFAPNYFLNPKLSYYSNKQGTIVSGSCLKQDKTMYNHKEMVSIYIAYGIKKFLISAAIQH